MIDYKKEINCIYGEAATGKTTLAKIAAIKFARDGKVVFIDSERGFNLERFKQLSFNNDELLKNIIVLKPRDLNEQELQIKSLSKIKDLKLIIIDTIGYFYRISNKIEGNMTMHRQFNMLSELSSKIPIILTNQVYTKLDSRKREMVGGEMFKNWCKRIIRLEKDPRRIIFEKPINKEIYFEIMNNGILLK